MTDHNWSESGKHPPLGTIVLHLDGDLDETTATAINQHFSDCWECRALRDTVARGIQAFMEYRQDVLLPSVPSPSPRRHAFRLQSGKALADVRRNFVLSTLGRVGSIFARQRIATGITAAVSAAVLIFLITIPVAQPPRLTAASLLERARASTTHGIAPASAATASQAKKIVYQKIQFRSGNRSIEREVVLAGAAPVADTAPPDADWARLLAATPIDWRDPLGVERYERWREEQGKGRDTVSESNGIATLSTVPAAPTLIESASLTVREADWHPIAKQVNFVDRAPLEVRELDYGVRDLPEPEMATSANKSPVHAPEAPVTPISDVAPQAVDLDEAEVHLREVLHKIGADLNEAPEIVRDGSVIRLRAATETTDRKQELLASVEGIPHISAEVSWSGAPPESRSLTSPAPVSPMPASPMYATTPPLIKPLEDFLGGLDPANTYLHSVRDSYRETLIGASALERLAARYSDAEWEQLAPDLRMRVDRLAGDYIESLRQHSDIYMKGVSLGLDEMLSQAKISVPVTLGADGPCHSWRADAPSAGDDLRRLETAFQRLFVTERTDQPLSLSAEALLVESANLRARYAMEIDQFCPSLPRK